MIPLLTFVMAIAYVPGLASPASSGRAALLMAVPALLVWRRVPRTGPGHWMMLGLLLWVALGVQWSSSPLDTAGGAFLFLGVVATFFAASQTPDLRSFSVALGLGVAVSVPFGVAQVLGYSPVENATGGFAGLHLTIASMGEIALVSSVLALGLRQWPIAVSSLACVALSGTREAVLGLAAAGSAAALRLVPRGARAPTLVAVVVVCAVLLTLDSDSYSRIHSVAQRLEIWFAAVSGVGLVGDGYATFGDTYPTYAYAHSDPLQILRELGPVGLVLSAGVALHALSSDYEPGSLALVSILAASTVGFPLQTPSTMFLVAVLAGQLCGDRDRWFRLADARERGTRLSDEVLGALAAAEVRATYGRR